jgi:hypothetical protein
MPIMPEPLLSEAQRRIRRNWRCPRCTNTDPPPSTTDREVWEPTDEQVERAANALVAMRWKRGAEAIVAGTYTLTPADMKEEARAALIAAMEGE